MNISGNPKAIQLVLILIAIFMVAFGWSKCARAQPTSSSPVFFASFGPNYTSTEIRTAEGLRVGIEYGPFQVSVITHGKELITFYPEANYYIDSNIGACGTWHRNFFKRMSVGWGACFWEHGDFDVGDAGPLKYDAATNTLMLDDDGLSLTGALTLRALFGKRQRVYAEWFHTSSAGSTHYNRGRNLISVGIRSK